MNTEEIITYFSFTLPIVFYLTSHSLINDVSDSIKLNLKGRYALDMLSLGNSPEKYRWLASDIRMDSLAKTLFGKKNLSKLESLTELHF